MLGGDGNIVRHYFVRCLQLGWVTTRGEEPMKINELAYITLCRAMGFHKTPQMEEFAIQQEHAPYFDDNGVNFLVYWNDLIKNGPSGVHSIEFNQTAGSILVYEHASNGAPTKRVFKTARTKKTSYGSTIFQMDQLALAHLHSSAITNHTTKAEEIEHIEEINTQFNS